VRKVFFSFHYERDLWRANQIRNSYVTKPNVRTAGFRGSAAWEEIKRRGDESIKKWIQSNLRGTSVTVVLIGTETITRTYVCYEIEQSCQRGNGIVGIYIHQLKDQNGETEEKGENPLDCFKAKCRGEEKCLSDIYPTYDWVADEGYKKFGDWIEAAARTAGRRKCCRN
jgi:hypothetical protein